MVMCSARQLSMIFWRIPSGRRTLILSAVRDWPLCTVGAFFELADLRISATSRGYLLVIQSSRLANGTETTLSLAFSFTRSS